ncbi:hypothetical protein [Armatimonas sp.]|uniref:hypothetical protein n=1 Tax=Armatimonas sp. TaxID=1872638 RepID=UPI00286AD404|nr:hypothetical protein [Armatimonas sp.]
MKPATSATAIKNASRDAKNYSLNDLLAADGMWLVVHKTDSNRKYIVDTNDGTCDWGFLPIAPERYSWAFPHPLR